MTPRRQPNENELQQYTADVLAAFGVPGIVGFHIPNENVDVQWRIRNKRMGVRAGAPDWMFLLPGGKFACLELKTLKGHLRPAQKQFRADVRALGGIYEVARSPEEIDGVLSALGIINKPIQRLGALEGGGTATQAIGLPSRKISRVAA